MRPRRLAQIKALVIRVLDDPELPDALGVRRIAAECGVSTTHAMAALKVLRDEGEVFGQPGQWSRHEFKHKRKRVMKAITAAVPEELHAEIKIAAAEAGVTISEFVRQALVRAMGAQEDKGR